ncbi:hypothetical protein AMK30_29420 [Streptomyces sp. CB02460]|nr:hypothetical protein AMK30_29420 [Streptomyces sp. CB02460]
MARSVSCAPTASDRSSAYARRPLRVKAYEPNLQPSTRRSLRLTGSARTSRASARFQLRSAK